MTVYSTINMTSGMRKNMEMLPRKKRDGQKVSTFVKHTGTYWILIKIPGYDYYFYNCVWTRLISHDR